MTDIVYEAHYDGMVFTFDDDGRAWVRLRREPDATPEFIFATGKGISHRAFNKLCKAAIKEGDCDFLLARKADEDALRNAKKKHVDALYEIARGVAADYVEDRASCHVGICPPEQCSRCGPILEAKATLKAIDDDYKRRARQ